MTTAKECGNFNEIPGISFFTATASAILAVGTTTTHALILYAIIKDRKSKFKLFFYKLLLNISIADILTGIFTDPYSAVFHVQEGLLQTPINIVVIHVTLYLFGGVPLMTMIVLSVDRIMALLQPMTYRNGIQGHRSWLILVAIWVLSAILIAAYFAMGFIPYLILFAALNIAFAIIAMLVTYAVYRKKLGRDVQTINAQPNASPNETPSRRRQNREKRATRTFLIMSVVVMVSYFPTCIAMGYMNSCRNCNCAVVHSLRDIAIVSILAGALFRAINFMACLRSLQTGLCVIRIERKTVENSQISSDQPKLSENAKMAKNCNSNL